jgi:hypothetical protein
MVHFIKGCDMCDYVSHFSSYKSHLLMMSLYADMESFWYIGRRPSQRANDGDKQQPGSNHACRCGKHLAQLAGQQISPAF